MAVKKNNCDCGCIGRNQKNEKSKKEAKKPRKHK